MRIEGFSDAVFAFAMTLLVVSLEVPKTFEELKAGFHGMIGFGICFLLLFRIWQDQHAFFRMYYLRDQRTITLNGILLFVVLFYVYPLKFLFSLMTEGNTVMDHGHALQRVTTYLDIRELMLIYATGFVVLYIVFSLMYMNALRLKDEIHLTSIEIFHTWSNIHKFGLLIGVGALAGVMAYVVSDEFVFATGMTYILIGPSMFIYFRFRHKYMRKRFTPEELDAHKRYLEE